MSELIMSQNLSILEIAQRLTPGDFEEKLAENIRVCASTGKQVSIAYHTFGDPANAMLLLVPGLGCQGLTIFDSATCTWLSQQGFYVVRIDNRDVGLSTKFDDVPQRILMPLLMLPNWLAFGEKQPYTLDDMADDASSLIRHLSPSRKVHVVGVSMGGMIAQCMALRNPELIQSLTLIMTHSGNHRVPSGKTPVSTLLGMLYKPKSKAPEDIIQHERWFFETYLMGGNPKTRILLDLVGEEFVRSTYKLGTLRQTLAIQRAPCRDELLKSLAIPTHIVHGGSDRLVPVANGYHLHATIPGSKLSIYPQMGHLLDDDHAQQACNAITTFIKANAL